jgi:hypothetical protein
MSSTAAGPMVSDHRYSSGAVGLTVFAATLMILGGVFHAIQGLVALVNDDFYVVGQEYVFTFDLTSWGWIHLVVGVVVALAGISLLSGAVWARTVAVIVVSLSIIANFMWLPYYPLWSVLVIAFDVFVIWAVTVHGRDVARA